MPWWSSRESIKEERVSVLAIVETLLAIGVAIGIYFYSGSLVHIAVSAALAPFLLLRTPKSMEQGIAIGSSALMQWPVERFLNWVDKTPEPRGFSGLLGLIAFLALMGLEVAVSIIIKIGVTSFNLFMHPLESIGALPGNWRRVVLCTDTATAPEILPGIGEYRNPDTQASHVLYGLDLDHLLDRAREMVSERDFAAATLLVLIFPLIYIPAGLYRWSLKSTALIWSPLVWAFRPVHPGETTIQFAHGIVGLSIYRFARWYSTIVLALFVGKLYIWVVWLEVGARLSQFYGWTVISSYLVPESIPIWHIAAAVNAVLTWIIYFRTERFLHFVDHGIPTSEKAMDKFFSMTFAIRNALSIYTAVCTLYITKELSGLGQLPGLRFVGFPW
jgi:hypothetical protein